MSAIENKELMQQVFAELARGNGTPFVESMGDDFCWTITGTTAWSRTYRGKEEVLADLIRPLFAQFADRYTNSALRILADEDHVVVECRGRVTTKAGKPYNNEYCYVIRMADGKMRELTEYMDTQLAATALSR